MRSKALPSIRGTMLLLSIVPLLLMAAVYTLYGTLKPYNDARESFLLNGRAVASYIAASAEFGVFYNNREPLAQLGRAALRDSKIEAVVFADAKGEELYLHGVLDKSVTVNHALFTADKPTQYGQSWYFSAPIVSSNIAVSDYELAQGNNTEEIIGYVLVVESGAETLLSQREIIVNNLFFSVACLLAAVLLSIRLSRAITQPVDTLTALAETMASGNLNERVGGFSLRELDSLGNSFNDLAARVDQSNQALNQRIEEATRLLRESSEDLAAQNHQLEDARQQLLLASKAKDEFLARMSHELRTPLTTVIGFSTLLKKTVLAADQKEYSRAIEQASGMLLALIDDILDFTKFQSNAVYLEVQPFDWVRCVEDIISMHAHAAFSKKLELVLLVDSDVPRLLMGDTVRVRQIFNNILGNAIKFTAQGEVVVTLSLDTIVDDRAQLRVSIRDSGIGIPESQQSALFSPFSQADSSISRRFGGTGLGLVISRQLVELMGGEISLQNAPDRGLEVVFSLNLPLQQAESQEQSLLPGRGEALLIYDPHAQSRRALRNMALGWSTHVFACGSARRLSQQLQQSDEYHAVIVGIGASEVNDPQLEFLLGTIRRDYAGPVLLLACMDNVESILSQRLLEEYKPIACLSKPLRQQTLFEYLNDLGGEALSTGGGDLQGEDTELPLQGSWVLVAEDNVLNRELIARLLQAAGAICVAVGDGRQAIEMASADIFDVILMDMHMPDIDGPEAATAIRSSSGPNSGTPIVGLTANVLARDETRFKVCGANVVLNKPINEDLLIDTLVSLVGGLAGNSSFKGFLADSIDEQQYRQEVQQHYQEMKKSWECKSLERLYFYCHQLVGLVEAFGDEELMEPVRRLHDSLQLQHHDHLEEYFKAAEEALLRQPVT